MIHNFNENITFPRICDHPGTQKEWKSTKDYDYENLQNLITNENIIQFNDLKKLIHNYLDYEDNSPKENTEEMHVKEKWFNRLEKHIAYNNQINKRKFYDFLTNFFLTNKKFINVFAEKGFYHLNLNTNSIKKKISNKIEKIYNLKKFLTKDGYDRYIQLDKDDLNFLNKVLNEKKIINNLSFIAKKFVKIKNGILQLSKINDEHHNKFLKDLNCETEFLNLHYDPKKDVKIIIYLSKVEKDNGPLQLLEKNKNLKIDNLEDFFSRVTSVGNYCENETMRRFMFRFPKKLRVTSNIGKLIFLNSDLHKHIKQNIFTVTSEIGNTIIFKAGEILHGGGNVTRGERLNLQLIVR